MGIINDMSVVHLIVFFALQNYRQQSWALQEAESSWAKMQTRSKIKRKATKQAEISLLEPYRAVKAVKIEIEAIKIKGQIEETFLRFPHIGEQIFER